MERIWRRARGLYRSGVHPALQVCVRHRGAVVLNRAIGHARGNGPGEPVAAYIPGYDRRGKGSITGDQMAVWDPVAGRP